MFITKIKTEAFLVRSGVQLNQLPLPPNQSLKLTEPAVDDFARAKNSYYGNVTSARIDLPSLRQLRCRSLAPVR